MYMLISVLFSYTISTTLRRSCHAVIYETLLVREIVSEKVLNNM